MRIDALPIGNNPPEDVNVIIEVPVGGEPIKYEMNKEAGTLVVDRFLYTAMRYPGNYGFIPHTLSDDGDPCDVLVANTRAIVPGAVMSLLGALVMLTSLTQIDLFGRTWDVHAMVGGALLFVVGAQVCGLGLCAHAYGTYFMGERDPWFDRARRRFRLEHGLLLGGLLAVAGMVIEGAIIWIWIDRGFGALAEQRIAVLGAALLIVGIQMFFTSFQPSILGLRRDAGRDAAAPRAPDA